MRKPWLEISILGFLFYALLVSSPYFSTRLNSDLLYLPALFHDFIRNGFRLGGWSLPPAPGFIPDMAIYFAVSSLIPDVGPAFTVSGIILFLLTLVILYRGFRKMEVRRPGALIVTATTGLFVAWYRTKDSQRLTIDYLFSPSFHVGALVSGLFILYLLSDEKPRVRLAGLVGMVAVASDPLVLAQMFLPLALVKRDRRTFILLAASTAGGMGLRFLIPRALGVSIPALADSLRHFDRAERLTLVQDMERLLSTNFLLVILAGGAVLWVGLEPREGVARLWTRTLLLSAMLSPIVLLLTRGWIDITFVRYVLPTVLYPLFILAIALTRIPPGRVVPLFGSLVILLAGHIRSVVPMAHTHYSPGVQCLDRMASKYGAHFGYGDYWTAKYVSEHSRQNVWVNQLTESLTRFDWINNARWYEKPFRDGQEHGVSFIVVNRLSRDLIVKKFGEPGARENCADYEVFLYPDAHSRLRDYSG